MSEADRAPVPVFDRRAIPAGAVESRWIAPDGAAVRRIDWPPPPLTPRGSLLFLLGRGDPYEKYLETLDHWHGRGWRVTALDWRGQGGSGRLGLDPHTGHVDDFADWVADLAAFWAGWTSEAAGPRVVVAHSMGGHLALRALAERRIAPDALVLSAPMLGISRAGLPLPVLHAVARLMVALGDPRRAAWKWRANPGALPADRIALLTHDAARYADELWWRAARPELVMGPASWGWVGAALASMRRLDQPDALEGIHAPVMMLATEADRLVAFGAIERAARRLPCAELLRFGPEARHEILRETDPVRGKALAAIEEFLDRAAPAR